jgi:CheY-like chemotaxis protein
VPPPDSKEVLLLGGRPDERAVVGALLRIGRYAARAAGDWEAVLRRIRQDPGVAVVALMSSSDGAATGMADRLRENGHTGPFVAIRRPSAPVHSASPGKGTPTRRGGPGPMSPGVLVPPITATELLASLEAGADQKRLEIRATRLSRSEER